MGVELSANHKAYILQKYPKLKELIHCVREFREVYEKKSIPLYLFIERYKNSDLYNYSSNFPHFIGFPACPLVK